MAEILESDICSSALFQMEEYLKSEKSRVVDFRDEELIFWERFLFMLDGAFGEESLYRKDILIRHCCEHLHDRIEQIISERVVYDVFSDEK